jgi:hypothetical protein
MSTLRERNSIGKEVEPGWTDPSDLNVYGFRYSHEVPVRVDDGAGDTKFSHMERREGWYHVAARTPAFAQAAYDLHYPASIYTRHDGPTPVLIIDAMAEVGKCWRPHP